MAIELAHRFEQISAKAYEHPADRAAIKMLIIIRFLCRLIMTKIRKVLNCSFEIIQLLHTIFCKGAFFYEINDYFYEEHFFLYA